MSAVSACCRISLFGSLSLFPARGRQHGERQRWLAGAAVAAAAEDAHVEQPVEELRQVVQQVDFRHAVEHRDPADQELPDEGVYDVDP